MKYLMLITAVSASMLSGCAVLPGNFGDSDKFCHFDLPSRAGDVLTVEGSRDFWLTSAGNYLSDRELAQTGTRMLDDVAGILNQPTQEPGHPQRVRMFRIGNADDSRGQCVPILHSASDYREANAQLRTGRRLLSGGSSVSSTGYQVYHRTGLAGFRYKVL